MTDIDPLIARLQARLHALGERSDTLTDAERAAVWTAVTSIQRVISGLKNALADLDRPTAMLADLDIKRTAIVNARIEIERLIEQAPDWREIRDRTTRDREWGRQQDLLASRRALANGVEYFGGVPAVPNALKRCLGVIVESDGREVPKWYGTLSEVDAQVTRWSARRAAAEGALTSFIAQAEQWLAKTAPMQTAVTTS